MKRIQFAITIPLLGCFCFITSALAQLELGNGVVGCSFSESALTFDLDAYEFGSSFNLMPQGEYPFDATMTPNGREVWLTGASGAGVVVVDVASGIITQRIWVGDYPVSVAFSADGSLALISCRDEREIWRIDTTDYQILGQTDTGFLDQGPGNIALDPVSGCFYLAEWASNTLCEISPDGMSVLRTVTFGEMFWQLVVAPDGSEVYIVDRFYNAVWVLDRASFTPADLIDVGSDPWGLDISADGRQLVVSSRGSDSVAIIETETGLRRTLSLVPEADPRDVDILDSQGLAFVTGGWLGDYLNPIFVIDIELGLLEETIWVPEPAINANVIAVQAQMPGLPTEVADSPRLISGLRSWPNPFNPKTEISFNLAEPARIGVEILDVRGRLIHQLSEGYLDSGEGRINWDGKDSNGNPLPTGVYICRLIAAGEIQSRKLTLLQ